MIMVGTKIKFKSFDDYGGQGPRIIDGSVVDILMVGNPYQIYSIPDTPSSAYLVKIDESFIVKNKFTYAYPHLIEEIL